MAKNNVYAHSLALSLPVPAGTKSGDAVKVGDLVGVAITDAASTTNWGGGNPVGNASVALDGTWLLDVAGAVTQVGSKVYITDAGAVTATASGNTAFGEALDLKDSAAAPIRVKLIKN